MPAIMVILNLLFAGVVVAVVAGAILAAIATQHRDHGVSAAGPLLRRRVWSRGPRAHAGPVHPWVFRNGQAWPTA
jgi:hypothetical protein